MITQRFFAGRNGVAALVLAGLIAAGAALAVALRRNDAAPRSLAEQIASAEAGEEHAIRSLGAALDAAPAGEVRPLISSLLRSEKPQIRAAAAAWVGRHRDPRTAPLLVPRLSDQDWRVRAAAFDAVQRVAGSAPDAPRSDVPLRDTPVEQREDLIFRWINAWRAAGDALPKLPDHCELYAFAGGRWLTGRKLAASCLACHAPPDKHASSDFIACASCHDAHAEWSASAHARSTTHVNLLRVNERTKEVARFDPGPREGLVCTSCHLPTPAGDKSSKPAPPGTETLFVPHHFQRAPSAGCATCHAESQAEWETWKASPRPMALRWLPGEVTWDDRPDAQNCVSCHMQPRRGSSAGGLLHGFVARRDPSILRGGLAARIEPPTGSRSAQLVLTNLAGHRYPSGTIRRALRIDVRYDTEDGEESNPARLLTRLTDADVPTTQPIQPALSPAEQRRIDVPTVPGASRVTCTITYERNHFEPGSYELPLFTLTERISAPPSP